MPVGAARVRFSLEQFNAASREEFVAAMAPLFEGAPRFLAHLASARPFRDEDELFERATAIALSMPEAEQVELADAHPRIGAPPGAVSCASFVEQGYDRTEEAHVTAAAERARLALQQDLDRLNAEYESRFGFRFVVFVAGRPRSAIVPLIEERLGGDRDAELRSALIDVVLIARDRWWTAR